ncbi:MAG: FtsX-like permease family protein [Candidatus Latescibacteria bacterium]|nr:FtsX-like permease family protein [Candidatus Latescibacterota bacterium]
MLKNYLFIALRNMWRNKIYSLINILGLAVGLAVCLSIFLYVQDQLSFDQYHQRVDRIYRLVSNLQTPDRLFHFAVAPHSLAPVLETDFPHVQHTVRFEPSEGLIRHGTEQFQENRVFYADQSVFAVFTFPLLQGDPQTALEKPYSAVITQAVAKKYFGQTDPIGQILEVAGAAQPYRVTGLLAEIPSSSHFAFDILFSFSTWESINSDYGQSWFSLSGFTYLLLTEKNDPHHLEARFPDFIERHMGDVQRRAKMSLALTLQPLAQIYLHSDRRAEIGGTGNVLYLYLFSAVAAFVLAIACINFVNLVTARSLRRAREVGVRKVIGASRAQLVRQFLGESALLSLLALGAALGLTTLMLPTFNAFSEKTLALAAIYQSPAVLVLVGLVLLVGLAAGLYPAFTLSDFQPAATLKGAFHATPQGSFLRRGLVVFQFAVSTILIVGTIIVYSQLDYLRNKDLGFDPEQILVIPFRGDPTLQQQYESIKTAFIGHPAVVQAAASSNTPDNQPVNLYAEYETEAGDTHNSTLRRYSIDYDFAQTYGLQLVAGRLFAKDFATDATEAFVVNEAAVPYLGWTGAGQAIGKRFVQSGRQGRIIGVVKDFHFASLHWPMEPLVFTINPSGFSYFSLRLRSHQLVSTMTDLEELWKERVSHRPFEYAFLDENLDSQYRSELRLGQLFAFFAVLAVLVGCLGLFGLSSFTVEQRRKEIGLRKVLGASVPNVLILLSREFLQWVVAANIIAWPIAYYAMDKWLEGFPYRTDIEARFFVLGGIFVLAVTWLTVSFQSIRAALTNPVDALTYE